MELDLTFNIPNKQVWKTISYIGITTKLYEENYLRIQAYIATVDICKV